MQRLAWNGSLQACNHRHRLARLDTLSRQHQLPPPLTIAAGAPAASIIPSLLA
jgi:hypothetical protein